MDEATVSLTDQESWDDFSPKVFNKILAMALAQRQTRIDDLNGLMRESDDADYAPEAETKRRGRKTNEERARLAAAKPKDFDAIQSARLGQIDAMNGAQ